MPMWYLFSNDIFRGLERIMKSKTISPRITLMDKGQSVIHFLPLIMKEQF